MLCQSCEKRPATVHITDIDPEHGKKSLELCEECAGSKGQMPGGAIPSLLAALVEEGARATGPETRCPECGVSFEEFRARGRFGCPKDYEVFGADLAPLLEKVHGASRHTGRLPRSGPLDAAGEERLRRLRRDLSVAVKEEKYEEAARLRDEIKTAEEALRGTR